MKRIEVVNINKYEGDDYIYIGRPSLFGNPYTSKDSKIAEYKVDSKKEAIACYKEYILENINILDELIRQLKEKGYNKIGCFCKPSGCHGDVLKELIEQKQIKSIF